MFDWLFGPIESEEPAVQPQTTATTATASTPPRDAYVASPIRRVSNIRDQNDYTYRFDEAENNVDSKDQGRRRNLYTILAILCLAPAALLVGLASGGFFRTKRAKRNSSSTSATSSDPSIRGGNTTSTEAPSPAPLKRSDTVFLLETDEVLQTLDGPKCIRQATLNSDSELTICIQQLDLGKLVLEVRDDTTGQALTWSSSSSASAQDDYWTRLQGDGNLVTKQGVYATEDSDPNIFAAAASSTNEVVWASGSVADPNGVYHFVYNAAIEQVQVIKIETGDNPSSSEEANRSVVLWASPTD